MLNFRKSSTKYYIFIYQTAMIGQAMFCYNLPSQLTNRSPLVQTHDAFGEETNEEDDQKDYDIQVCDCYLIIFIFGIGSISGVKERHVRRCHLSNRQRDTLTMQCVRRKCFFICSPLRKLYRKKYRIYFLIHLNSMKKGRVMFCFSE